MLLRADWVTDNDSHGKRKAHGEDLDESIGQEGAEESAGSEKKCHMHCNAKQIHRCVTQSRGGVGKVKMFSDTLCFFQETCVDFVWSTIVFCPQSRV